MIRLVERDDIPTIVDLHRRIFGVPPGTPQSDDLDYGTIFFDHPWFDPEIRSILYEKDGELLGFMGIVARPMMFKDRRIRMAVPTRFMVDAERGGALIAVQLLKHLATMPIDLAVNDSSNDVMREVWLRARAEVFHFSSLRWTRAFQPLEWARWRLRQGSGAAGTVGRWSRPATWPGDALVRRMGWNDFSSGDGLRAEPTLDASRLLPVIEAEGARRSLRPVLDESTFAWQLAELGAGESIRRLRGAVVLDKRDRDVGWYLYIHEPRGPAEVLQLGALRGREEAVFATLSAEAHDGGAIALTGRTDPRFLPALAHQRCTIKAGIPWSLLVSTDPDIVSALQCGDAHFSRLEGEWW